MNKKIVNSISTQLSLAVLHSATNQGENTAALVNLLPPLRYYRSQCPRSRGITA